MTKDRHQQLFRPRPWLSTLSILDKNAPWAHKPGNKRSWHTHIAARRYVATLAGQFFLRYDEMWKNDHQRLCVPLPWRHTPSMINKDTPWHHRLSKRRSWCAFSLSRRCLMALTFLNKKKILSQNDLLRMQNLSTNLLKSKKWTKKWIKCQFFNLCYCPFYFSAHM